MNGNGDRKNIAGEMADSYIMLAQLELIYGNHHDVVAGIREKLARTLERVEAERIGTTSSVSPSGCHLPLKGKAFGEAGT